VVVGANDIYAMGGKPLAMVNVIAGGEKERLRRAVQLQFRMPGPPIIYYGTEVGMSQKQNYWEARDLAVSRDPMLWGVDQDRELEQS